MSYNPTPKWAKTEIKQAERGSCPHCAQIYGGAALIREISERTAHGYYHPAYVPPYVVVTCDNCEEDYDVPLTVHIIVGEPCVMNEQ